MAITYSGAVSASAPAVADTNASQATGASVEGIGLTGANNVSLGGSRIGGSPGTDFVFKTG